LSTKEGWLVTWMRSALPFAALGDDLDQAAGGLEHEPGHRLGHRQDAGIEQHGGDTQMELEPDIGGVSSGSMMIQPICAFGFLGGTSRLTWRKTPPRGSLSTKLRSAWSRGDEVALLPDRVAGRRRDAADDDVADLALGVGGNSWLGQSLDDPAWGYLSHKGRRTAS
jgi:hypothetical protein